MNYKNKMISVLSAVVIAVCGLGIAGQAAAASGVSEVRPLMLAAAEVSSANVFNRNLKKPKKLNPPPPEDGIHDTANEATFSLQAPLEAYKGLPKTTFGNRVDWVKAIDQGLIKPRWDRLDSNEEPFVMDLDIVRPVKASVDRKSVV